ncbi:MAG: imidazole glycerol phosphate synthase subunit HisF [Candidatus Caenarcaniphilales bacterium]|nr:imidazole glycerol phosphate synthase subunit HisF [Candidatus Caenarcaniphilales bacterium]
MLKKRIIPCLDVKNGRVVKGVNFVGLKDAGDPVELAKSYNESGADEICFLDITASFEARKALIDVINRTATEVFIPLTVGGGVNRPEDIGDLLRAGADKVSINSGAVKDPSLIQQGASQYGSQCIVIAIDVKKSNCTHSNWEVFIKGGREATGIDVIEWAKRMVNQGAGEILLTSMDADGTKAGYDISLTSAISEEVNVPVIASGGAGSLKHIIDVFKSTKADAALLASMLHYGETTIPEIKNTLLQEGVLTRIIE